MTIITLPTTLSIFQAKYTIARKKGDGRRDDTREERRTKETMRDGNDRRDEERKGERQRQRRQ